MSTKPSAGARIGTVLLVIAVVVFAGWQVYTYSQKQEQIQRIEAIQDSGWKPPAGPTPNPQDVANNVGKALDDLKRSEGK